jgi:serine/threonine-protein kinase
MATEKDSVPLPTEAKRPESEGSPGGSQTVSTVSIWERIKRHKVVEWTLAYVAFGYALLHGVQMLREAFDWPFLVSRLTVIGLVLGAPIVVTLAWFHGHRARHRVSGRELAILIALLVVAGSVLWWVSGNSHERATAPAATSSAAAFTPPPHSIAVLPFVNMSGDKEQEYFSDGLSEELLNSLARINELQVAARTSSFYFKGEHEDLATIAHKLNVASVLEGSVRRSGHTIRVTAQLNNAVTGFHLWSQTYDRDLGDVLKLQTEIATAVATALKVTLLGDISTKIELGGTHNPAAFDAYLRGSKAHRSGQGNEQDLQAAMMAYSDAIRLDPNYTLAYAARADASSTLADLATQPAHFFDYRRRAQADASKAITMTPELAEGHWASAGVAMEFLEFIEASQEFERALALSPGKASMLGDYGTFAVLMGRTEAGLAAAHHSVMLDPLNAQNHYSLGISLVFARRYSEAVAALTDAKALDLNDVWFNRWLGTAYYVGGNFESARTACESHGGDPTDSQLCLAYVYDKMGRHADAESLLASARASWGDAGSVQYVEVYAQWGQTAHALDWLEMAMRHRNPYLRFVKADPLMDPLRNEPRFQAIVRELKFPD